MASRIQAHYCLWLVVTLDHGLQASKSVRRTDPLIRCVGPLPQVGTVLLPGRRDHRTKHWQLLADAVTCRILNLAYSTVFQSHVGEIWTFNDSLEKCASTMIATGKNQCTALQHPRRGSIASSVLFRPCRPPWGLVMVDL